jgi:hypothetical protein
MLKLPTQRGRGLLGEETGRKFKMLSQRVSTSLNENCKIDNGRDKESGNAVKSMHRKAGVVRCGIGE